MVEEALVPLTAFDAVLMRQDPPFDFEYVAATWLLERAEAEGARIWNKPRAIRDHSEKVAIAEFPQFTPTTLIARDPADIHAFIDELARLGLGLIVVSSELPEILALSDRVLVMCEGRQTAEFSRAEATEQRILEAATGG